jgi:uncharacterized membrane protein YqjE
MSDAAEPQSDDGSLRATVAQLGDALLGLARTRFELAAVEYAEERRRVGQQLVLLVAGIGCLLFALLFFAAGFIAYFWDTHRVAAIVGVILVFAAAGAVMLWRRAEIGHSAATPFAASLAELEKDRAALGRTMRRRSASRTPMNPGSPAP